MSERITEWVSDDKFDKKALKDKKTDKNKSKDSFLDFARNAYDAKDDDEQWSINLLVRYYLQWKNYKYTHTHMETHVRQAWAEFGGNDARDAIALAATSRLIASMDGNYNPRQR